MKKRIGILTYHASHNYGSMLQAYALCAKLNEMGYDAQIINFRSSAQKMMYAKPYKYWDAQSIKGRLLSPSLFIKNIGKWRKYELFLREEMPITYEINHPAGIRKFILDNHYDAVIVGSDQIWNTNATDFNIGYLLPFQLPCKKIAYAPSMGHLKWLSVEDTELILKSTLSDFTHISAREQSMAHALSSFLQKPIVTMPDPAWLVSKDRYDAISYSTPLVKGKYVFYYEPRHEHERASSISKYARLLGLKTVCSSSPDLACKGCVNYNNAGPKEFLNLVKNAEMVCGNSMHMLVFSLLFHKSFLLISDEVDTRMMDLLKWFGLENRIVNPAMIDNIEPLPEIHWDAIDTKINELRMQATEFLSNAIND